MLLFKHSPWGYPARHGPESGFVERRPRVFIHSFLFVYFLVFSEGGIDNAIRCCLLFLEGLQKCLVLFERSNYFFQNLNECPVPRHYPLGGSTLTCISMMIYVNR